MKKLNDIVGRHNHGRKKSAPNYDLAYAWYNSASSGRKTFTIFLSNRCLDLLRFREGDRCDLLIDDTSMTASIKLSKDGDYALTGKNSARAVKIASLEACQYLATIFAPCDGMRALETVAYTLDPSVTVKLNPA
jgi:hypothetical protein